MVVYADTSFLVSLYGQDCHSHLARVAMRRLRTPLVFTPLHGLECKNALRLALFRKEIDINQCRETIGIMEQDLIAGILLRTAVPWTDAFGHAETASAAHTSKCGSRSLDILHVACALALRAKTFLTLDRRQANIASRAGLKLGLRLPAD